MTLQYHVILMIAFAVCCLAMPLSTHAQSSKNTISIGNENKQSLRELFWEFLRLQEKEIGRDALLNLPKEQLFQRFLDWQKLRTGN